MKKVMVMMVLVITMLLSGCEEGIKKEVPSNEDEVTIKGEELPIHENVILKEVHVTEQSLSEIKTDESDWFINNANTYQPYLDDNGGMYYYCVFGGDSAKDYLYYNNGIDEPQNARVPEVDDFCVGVILDGNIYGIETERGFDDFPDGYYMNYFITKYYDGVAERLLDTPIKSCYFAEEGIYYQCGSTISLMDYHGGHSELVIEIPDELYISSVSSRFIVYRGKLWYCYEDYFDEHGYPFWNYDLNAKTFTKFDKGGLGAVNNGFLYYHVTHIVEDYDPAVGSAKYDHQFYRFNCETYCIELINDGMDIYAYGFCDDYILHEVWVDSGHSDLYRMDLQGSRKILSSSQLGHSDYILNISCTNGRIFVTGGSGMFYTCLAEIDIDGNIIKIIHEDQYW